MKIPVGSPLYGEEDEVPNDVVQYITMELPQDVESLASHMPPSAYTAIMKVQGTFLVLI